MLTGEITESTTVDDGKILPSNTCKNQMFKCLKQYDYTQAHGMNTKVPSLNRIKMMICTALKSSNFTHFRAIENCHISISITQMGY